MGISNQITVVTFQPVQLAQASFLQKKSNVAKCFFDICNAEMAQSLSSLKKSEFIKLIMDMKNRQKFMVMIQGFTQSQVKSSSGTKTVL